MEIPKSDLCLEFSNTVGNHASAHPAEGLKTPADLVRWAIKVGRLTAAEADDLTGSADVEASGSAVVLGRAITLREAIYRIFSAHAHGRTPMPSDMETLNDFMAEAFTHLRVTPEAGGFVWKWTNEGHALEKIVWPIARAAADLLTPDLLARVGECADEGGCGWLFLDTSKNHIRRWCDINDCGNRAKARRHYQRVRERKA